MSRSAHVAAVAVALPLLAAPAAATSLGCVPSGSNDGLTAVATVSCVFENGRIFTAECEFGAVLGPNNRLTVAYGGSATAEPFPLSTYIRCSISNSSGESAGAENVQPMTAVQVVGAPVSWRVSPIEICVSAYVDDGNVWPTPEVCYD